MQKKIKIGLLFGGRSAEHEVSVESAKSIYEALDKNKYEVTLIGIDKQGRWLLGNESEFLLQSSIEHSSLESHSKNTTLSANTLAIIPGNTSTSIVRTKSQSDEVAAIEIVFPILHGPFGEDGTVQGLLKLAGIPFVGPGVLGSAVGMDKDIMKRLLREAGVPCAKTLVIHQHSFASKSYEEISKTLGLPLFIKPANLGSSVGINKVSSKSEFTEALKKAFDFDTKVLVEEFIEGREIECSVLGNENPLASIPGEIIPQHEFYSYEAKYLDPQGALFQIPANLPSSLIEKIKELAVKTFVTLCCEGMARVDFFLKKDGEVLVNELNTIPGFTKISMYPKLWEASGISYQELLDQLIQLAIARHERDKKLKTSFQE